MLSTLILIPFGAALLSLGAWRFIGVQRVITALGALALFAGGLFLTWQVMGAGIKAEMVGSWTAPFGITLVADTLAAVMVAVTGLVALSGAVFSFATISRASEEAGYYPLFNFMIMGVTGAFLAGDLFNLYVWFEVLLIASFVLIALGGGRGELEGSIKYVTLNLLASGLFLAAAGIVYGMLGTLNMAQIAVRIGQIPQPELPSVVAVLLLCAFGVKAAVFPLFFWLPASYHTPPVAVTAVFSGLLTKVGVYAIIRTFTLMFVGDTAYTHTILLVVGGLTMIIGVLGAVAQMEMRRLLSFHIVSQIGYLLMGVGLHSIAGLAATIVFLVHVILAKAALFMVGGIVYRTRGSYDLTRLGGIVRESPGLAALFLLPALALAGIPPLSGFWGKFLLIRAGILAGEWVMVVVALGVSVLTLFSMIKIWNEAFWKNPPVGAAEPVLALEGRAEGILLYGPPLLFAGLTLMLGLGIGPFYEVAARAAQELMSPQLYIAAVLGGVR